VCVVLCAMCVILLFPLTEFFFLLALCIFLDMVKIAITMQVSIVVCKVGILYGKKNKVKAPS